MHTGKPDPGALYATSSGRTAEVVAYAALNATSLVESHLPVATTEVIAWRYLGGSVVHLTSLEDVMDWIKVPGE